MFNAPPAIVRPHCANESLETSCGVRSISKGRVFVSTERNATLGRIWCQRSAGLGVAEGVQVPGDGVGFAGEEVVVSGVGAQDELFFRT